MRAFSSVLILLFGLASTLAQVSAFNVVSAKDSGGGSLRQAMIRGGACAATSFSEKTLATVQVQPAVGLNKFDLFRQYLGVSSGADNSSAIYYQTLEQTMAKKAIIDAKNIGVTYFRVSATGFAPAAYNEPGDLDLYISNPAAYFTLFDRMLSDLNNNGIKIVPVFLWNATQFPSITGETLLTMLTNPNSKSYLLLQRYIADFISHYKDNPAIDFYELTNELNLLADLDVVSDCNNNNPYPKTCFPLSNFTTDQMITFTSRLAGYIKSLDPNHLISSGFSIPRLAAEHLRQQPGFSPQGPDFTLDSVAEFQKNLIDIHQGLDIVSIHFYNMPVESLGIRDSERFGIKGATNADLLEIVKGTTDTAGKLLYIGEFGDFEPFIREDRRSLFAQAVLAKIVELKIPFSSPWVWEYYQFATYLESNNANTIFSLEPGLTDVFIATIKNANKSLGNSVPPIESPDVTPPQVIITWPLENAPLRRNQFVNAVASDNNGSIARVEFRVDGVLKATSVDPPFHFILDPTQLSIASHKITATAFDPTGNSSKYSTNVSNQPDLSGPGVSLSGFSPTSGSAGTVVTIHGDNLTGAQLVLIGNIPASILSQTDTTITARVERGATGLVEVATLDGAASANGNFTLTQLLNISTRMEVLSGNSVLIGGFIIGGDTSKQVLLRALGPTLTQFGINGVLGDPTMELHDGSGALLASDDNWKDTQQAAINATGKAPPNDLESAILRTLEPGNYTAIVRGKNNTTGVALVDAYDLGEATDSTLTNISTRGFVDTGNNVMIGGFISGNGMVKVIVRALGPTLSGFGVPNVLADPTLELRDGQGTLLAANDNWADTQQAEIQASGFAPPNMLESAIVAVRPPGNSTAIVRGKNNTTGNALVEVYQIPY